MKRKESYFTKLLVGLLIALSALMLIAAGGRDAGTTGAVSGSAANVNPPGVFPICKTPITINVGVRQNNNVENYSTNLQTKWIEEKGNFSLNIATYPNGNPGKEKILVEIAAGGVLPEVLCDFAFTDDEMSKLGSDGIALKLNDYFSKWTYYFFPQMEKVSHKSSFQWAHSADGNIYHFPFISEQIGERFYLRAWINTKWLDKAGVKMPTTTAELRTVLEAFRDKDPNGNGKKDEIPAAGNTDLRGKIHEFLINAFIYNDIRDRLIVNNGKVDVIYNKPEYREALRYINGLVNDGLILNQTFTMAPAQLRALIESQNVATVGFFTAGLAGAMAPANQMKLDYTHVPPLKGPQGVQYTPYFPHNPQNKFVITKDARNPEAIFRWGDLMCCEEATIWSRFGVEGKDWRRPLPGEKGLYESIGFPAKLSPILAWGSIQNSHWANGLPGVSFQGIVDGMVANDNLLDAERWIAKAVPDYMTKIPPDTNRVDRVTLTLAESTEIADMKLAINTYVNENLALFATGQKSIEKDWDSYLREFDRLNLKRYLELTQSGYDRVIGKK